MSRRSAKGREARPLGLLLGGMFGVALVSQGWLQLVNGQNTLAKAKASSRWEVERADTARRGDIVSTDGKLFAQSNDVFELSLNYEKLPHTESFFLALANASGLSAAELMQSVASDGISKTWQQPLSGPRAAAVRKVKQDWFADGVSLRRVARREYPFKDVTQTLVGHFGEEGAPTGLESSQNVLLAGIDGMRQGLPDRKGAFLPMRMTGEDRRAVPGADLQLTIDSNVQIAATSALRLAVEQNMADQGVAVVMDPNTGDLLAAAVWVRGQDKEESNGFNPLVMARFEPGSTFKILTLAKAMDLAVVNPEATMHCGGSIVVGDKTIRCSHGAHGTIDGRKAISKSCNVASVKWAQAIGRDDFTKFFETSGLMDVPGIGLPGEVPGNYVRDEYAKRIQLANFGFGQALTATPVALCAAYNALAKDGIYHHPRLIKRKGEKDVPLETPIRLFREDTADTLLDFMASTFEDEGGTAHKLRIDGYRLGGKTGTAQKLDRNWRDDKRRYVSNFVGYVPAENPVATVLVMIDNPTAGQYYGGSVAGPVFRSIAEALIKQFNIPRTP